MSKFIEVVPYYSNSHHLLPKEDYMAIAPNVMTDKGYDCECVILKPNNIKLNVVNIRKNFNSFIKIKIFTSFLRYFLYLLKQRKATIFFNERIPSALIGFLFGKKNIFMSHQSTLPGRWWRRIVFKYCVRRFDKVRVVNNFEKDELIRIGVKRDKIASIPLAIDFDFFSKKLSSREKNEIFKKYKLNQDDIHIAFLGHVRKVKNIDTILKAVSILADTNKSVKLIVIGDDKLYQEGYNSIKEQARELNISNNIFVTGSCTPDEVVKVLNICCVGINSSSHEGQCLAVYEMASAGLPLCLSNMGPFTSVFGQNALFHDPNDFKTLAKNITVYLTTKNMATAFVSNNISLIKKEYTYELVYHNLFPLFNENKEK